MKRNIIIKSLATIICCVNFAVATAQNGINIPFSQYGVGFSAIPYNMPYAAQLGGVVYSRQSSNMVNPFNPASYAAIQPTSFVFDMGLSIDLSTSVDSRTSLYDADGNLGYISFAFPLSKWWKTAMGVLPSTVVNYETVGTIDNAPYGEMKTRYEGHGGLTRFFWGHGFNVTDRLSLGFNANYLFDNTSRAITYDFLANDTNFFSDSRREKVTNIRIFTFDFGAQYVQPLGEHYTLQLGLTFIPHQVRNVTDNSLIYTFVTYAGNEYLRDTIFPAADQSSQYTSTVEQPYVVGFGASLERNKRWLVAFDATYSPWSGMKYTENSSYQLFGASALRYDDNFRGSLGLQRVGDKDAQSYMRRVSYSCGFHYEYGKLQLQTAGTQYCINEWGLGAGMSLPMRKGRSVMNLSVNYSSMGTIDLLRRNCVTFGISIGSCETWFMKRKYN